MNVSLTPKLDNFVADQVGQGRYRSASEVVREGLRLLELRESKLQNLQIQVEEGRISGYNPGPQTMQRLRKNLAKKHRV
jgi:antitoxin ParD1/3/4